VRSYASGTGETLVLFDPLSPPADVLDRTAGREVAVLLTVWCHERSAGELSERLGATVFAPTKSLSQWP
jgi:hypothetical protein